METESRTATTIEELVELQTLEPAQRGESMEDVACRLRARLTKLRKSTCSSAAGTGAPSLENRDTKPEAGVRWLQGLIGDPSKNG